MIFTFCVKSVSIWALYNWLTTFLCLCPCLWNPVGTVQKSSVGLCPHHIMCFSTPLPVSTVSFFLFSCLSLPFISCSKLHISSDLFFMHQCFPVIHQLFYPQCTLLLGPSGIISPRWFVVFSGFFECSQPLHLPPSPPDKNEGGNFHHWHITVPFTVQKTSSVFWDSP